MASGYQKLGTQEASNDMYIVENVNELLYRKRSNASDSAAEQSGGIELYARSTNNFRGGETMNQSWDGTQTSSTLTANNAGGQQRMPDKENFNAVIEGDERVKTVVRRLTPTECERLQGYPDGWTLIGDPEMVEVKDYETVTDEEGNEKRVQVGTHNELQYFYTDSNGKKKKVTDSARYKALGNSIALPFWFYLLRRISAQYERPCTLGSLFDGLGGFPLCHERCNGPGTALWASEIEEFPIAVTKEHFPGGEEE